MSNGKGTSEEYTEESDGSRSNATSLPDLTEMGLARFYSSKVTLKEKEIEEANSKVGSESVSKFAHKHRREHRRVVSDTTVIFEKDIYREAKLLNVPEEENTVPQTVPSWKYPPPDAPDQSWRSYVLSGNFSQFQTPLDVANAHLILAETAIYHDHTKVKLSPIQQMFLPEEIKKDSAEHLLLQLLSTAEDTCAWEALKLLKDRGDQRAANLFEETRQIQDLCWAPPLKELNFTLPPRDK